MRVKEREGGGGTTSGIGSVILRDRVRSDPIEDTDMDENEACLERRREELRPERNQLSTVSIVLIT